MSACFCIGGNPCPCKQLQQSRSFEHSKIFTPLIDAKLSCLDHDVAELQLLIKEIGKRFERNEHHMARIEKTLFYKINNVHKELKEDLIDMRNFIACEMLKLKHDNLRWQRDIEEKILRMQK